MADSIIKFILDVGNSKIKMLAGELSNSGKKLNILKYVEVPSKGIRKNVIENQIYLSEAIAEAVNQMQEALGVEINKVVLGVGGTNIYSRTKNIKISFKEEKNITQNDINKIFESAEKELRGNKEKVLASEIYNIKINNSGIVKNPIGLSGKDIQADVHLIFINELDIDELTDVVGRAQLEVESIVLNPYASAKSTLNEADKKMGVALIDIGEGTIDIIIYKNNKLIYTKSLPLGGMHYVSDLKVIFKILEADAKKIMRELNNAAGKEDYSFLISGNKCISFENVKKVVDARTGDIVNFVKKAIEESGFTGYLGKGIYLTGGATRIDEIFEGVKSNLGYSVKRVLPLRISGLNEVKPEMATIVGILLDVMEKEYNKFEKQRIKKDEEEKKLKESIKVVEDIEQERTDEKIGIFKKIKIWFSNFI